MIKKIFNVKNPFWKSMGTVFDLFILNLLWMLCCIPIITIGPATTGAYYALIQRARGEQTEIHKDFFRSFKANLKQGIVLGLIVTLTGAFLAVDMYLCRINGTGIFSFFLFFFAVFFLAWAMTALYAFPILAKFERKTKDILAWAFTLSIKNLPMTALMLLLTFIGLYFCYRIPGLVFIMFGLLAQYCATIFASIFKPFLPEPWYMEYEKNDIYDYNPKSAPVDDFEMTPDQLQALIDEAILMGADPSELQALMNEGNDNE